MLHCEFDANRHFGWSLLLDFYDCCPIALNDLETNYRYLEGLVNTLNMEKFAGPLVFHGPQYDGKEVYPDKEGVSAWVALITSGIQIHTIVPKKFASVDIFSCGPVNIDDAINFSRQYFKFKDYESQFLIRGKRYNCDRELIAEYNRSENGT